MATPRRPRAVRPKEVAAVVVGALLLAASWAAVAVANHVPRLEARLFETVNDLPDFLWRAVWAPMQIGSFVGSLVVVAITGIVSRNMRLTLAALVASQLAFWLSKAVKTSVSRGRPADLLANVHLREQAHGLGYVSGHTAVAFSLAAVLAPSLPRRWQPVVWVVASLVAFARVYAGVHLPLDVVGGAGLGLLLGTFTRWGFGLGGEGLRASHPS